MVLARTNDAAVEGFSPSSQLRFLYADVSETARRLARGHGLSLPAAQAFGKVLAGLAAMSVDTGEDGELVALSADVSGRLGGFYAEIDSKGHLRGHVFETSPETLAPDPGEDPEDLFGGAATLKVTRLGEEDGAVRSQMSFQTSPATPESIFGTFFNASIPTKIVLAATAYGDETDRVRALAVQRLPGTKRSAYERVAGLFEDGTVADQLAFDSTLATFRDVIDLWDLATGPTRAIAFGCSCSAAKAEASWASLPVPVLEGMLRSRAPQGFRCHLCGRTWPLQPETVLRILQEKRKAPK